MSVVYGLLRQSKLHFLTALREVLLAHLKNQVKEVMVVSCRTDPDVNYICCSQILRAYLHVPEVEEEGEEPPRYWTMALAGLLACVCAIAHNSKVFIKRVLLHQ